MPTALGRRSGLCALGLMAACVAVAATAPAPAPAPNSTATGTNATTGEVLDAQALTRKLPLRQLRLLMPDAEETQGADAVTLVFSRAVIALGSNFGDLPAVRRPPARAARHPTA